jgi:hypothetical protein
MLPASVTLFWHAIQPRAGKVTPRTASPPCRACPPASSSPRFRASRGAPALLPRAPSVVHALSRCPRPLAGSGPAHHVPFDPHACLPDYLPAGSMRLQVRFSPQLGPSHLSHTPPPPQRPAASARMPSAFDAMTVVADFDSRSSYRKNQTCQNAPHHHTPDPHGMRPGVTRTRHLQPRPHLRPQRIVRAQRIACIPSASELVSDHIYIIFRSTRTRFFCGLFSQVCFMLRCTAISKKGVNQQHGLAANWSR